MEREQTHSKTKESLNEIINSDSVGESAKKEAVDKLAELADIMEKEAATEQLLASRTDAATTLFSAPSQEMIIPAISGSSSFTT